jgi:hypothetical protein
MSEKARCRVLDAAAVLALGLLTLAFFWKIALTNRVLAGVDVFAYFYPYRDYVAEALQAGRLPLWNPYLFMGAPLLANSQAAVLYPLHWPFLALSAPKQVAWSIALHVWLAAAGTYLFARRAAELGRAAALVAAFVFALGGFVGAQVEHVNQLNASSWLPWLLLCLEGAIGQGQHRGRFFLGGGAVTCLSLLAGHTQATYIVLFGSGIYALVLGVSQMRRGGSWGRLAGLRGLGLLLGMAVTGVVLAAGQLVPTWELSRLSVRTGGLSYQEAASFSLRPSLIPKAFLPPLAWAPPFSEYVAYIGLVGLALAALGTWNMLRRRRHGPSPSHRPALPSATLRASGDALEGAPGPDRGRYRGIPSLALVLVGVFLAFGAYNPFYFVLYTVVPGFDLFRAPARWLLLYAFGAAVLAGIGLESLPQLVSARRSVRWQAPILVLLVAELFLAGQGLAYNHPTAPAAFDSLRSAPAHLLADPSGQPFRFLSMSDIRYDPGDLADMQAMYDQSLPEREIYDLVVATKMKEVLAYNLPLRYRLFSVDGYDGGLLPTAGYVALERLFLPEEDIWTDGRLRQQLERVPPTRLLSLLNVKYVMTDKVQDAWIDDVFYDLQHTVALGDLILSKPPSFEATHLGIVSYMTGTTGIVDGTPVAALVLTDTTGGIITATLRAGEHTAEGLYSPGAEAHAQPSAGHHWGQNQEGSDYVAVLELGRPLQPQAIALHGLLGSGQLQLRGLTLIDQRTGTSRVLTVDPTLRLVHSGDVKIYQNEVVLPRAFIAHQASVVRNEQAARARLSDPGFDPARHVILTEGGEPLPGKRTVPASGSSFVEILSYGPEEIQIDASVNTPAYLVLTDAHYPGWRAEVDGESTPILRADLYFRAVRLEAGHHRITFQFRPHSLHWGLCSASVGWVIWILAFAVLCIRTGLRGATGV